jgi:tripartite-type tricarboxylate transporter receptor subunit TctC
MKTLLTFMSSGILGMAAFAMPGSTADDVMRPTANSSVTPVQVAQSKFDAAAYYKGKTIRVQVGFSAGGGTDLQARHFAAHWGKHFPGNPRFRVTNVRPNTASANRLYRSPPDGLTLEMTASSNVIRQFTSRQAKFKIQENRIIGSHTGSASVLFAHKDLSYKTLRDAIGGKKVIRIGQRNAKSGGAIRLAVVSEWLNIPMKFVPGARGTADNLIALERRDTDAYMPGGGGTLWYSLPFIRPGWLKNGTLRPFAMMGPSDLRIGSNKEMKMPSNVPYITDLLKDPKKKALFEAFSSIDTRYGKIFMAPPKTPDHIINLMRTSYAAILADKVFRAKLETMMGAPVKFTPGAEIEPILDQMVKDYAKNKDIYKKWIKLAKKRF